MKNNRIRGSVPARRIFIASTRERARVSATYERFIFYSILLHPENIKRAISVYFIRVVQLHQVDF